LRIGDLLVSHRGNGTLVDDVVDSGQIRTVYNLNVEPQRTYFVGAMECDFSVWVHNFSTDEDLEKDGE
jgi:hypothetical protein